MNVEKKSYTPMFCSLEKLTNNIVGHAWNKWIELPLYYKILYY